MGCLNEFLGFLHTVITVHLKYELASLPSYDLNMEALNESWGVGDCQRPEPLVSGALSGPIKTLLNWNFPEDVGNYSQFLPLI